MKVLEYNEKNLVDKLLHVIDIKFKKSEYMYMLISSAFISVTQLIIKLEKDTSVFQILLFRGIFTFLVNYNSASHGAHNIYPKSQRTNKLLITRAVLQSVTVVALFASCKYTDLSVSTVLWLSNPIWTQVVSTLFFGQKYNKNVTIYICLSFIGIISIFKPFKFMQSEASILEDQNNIYKTDFVTNLIGQALALSAAMSFAFLSNISSQLKGRTSASILIQYLYVGNTMFCAFMMIKNGNNDIRIYTDLNRFIPVLLVAITSLISQYLMQYALMKAKPQEIVPFIQIQVIFAIAFDCFIFGKSLEMLTIIGSIIILYSCYRIATMKKPE